MLAASTVHVLNIGYVKHPGLVYLRTFLKGLRNVVRRRRTVLAARYMLL